MSSDKTPRIGDPSTQNQQFINLKLNLLCCRYWVLDVWDCWDNSFPFWRIYWNRNAGGQLSFKDEVHNLTPDNLYLITPFTSFSSRYVKNHIYESGSNVVGRHIDDTLNEADLKHRSLIHLFIHFNLGVPFDNVTPGIYTIPLNEFLQEKVEYFAHRLKIENKDFKITFNLKLQSFIHEVLSTVGPELWKTVNVDQRVLTVLRHIESNISQKMSNAEIAEKVNMAPNSFARLFKNELHMSLHSFIQRRKIASACSMFEHTNDTIETIAESLGFSDRYHFSRVFKSVSGVTPASYRSGQSI